MIGLENVVSVCNVINEANYRLTQLIGEPVELRLVEPEIPGLYPNAKVIELVKNDYLKSVIIEVICEHFMISLLALRGGLKKQELSDARKIASVVLKKYVTKIKDEDIAAMLNIDRSTVSYHRSTGDDLVKSDKQLKFHYTQVLRLLKKKLNND